MLIEQAPSGRRVVGYYAISPTQILREDAPKKLSRGWPNTVPAWRLGKLAVHVDLRADQEAAWGRQLLPDALETIVGVAVAVAVAVADADAGGKVVVVDADNEGLLGFYHRGGFLSTEAEGGLTLYMKVSTARSVPSAAGK